MNPTFLCTALLALAASLPQATADLTTPVVIADDSWQTGTPGTAVTLDGCYVRNFLLGSGARRVKVIYTTTATGAAVSHNLPATDANMDTVPDWALTCAQDAEATWRALAGMGFPDTGLYADTDGTRTIDLVIFDLWPGAWGWCCWSNAYLIDVPLCNNGQRLQLKDVILHEHWHSVAWSDSRYPAWVGEGSAGFMEDFLFDDLDTSAGQGWVRWPNEYLGIPHVDLNRRAYSAALFWKYITEQLATTTTEPGYGSDVVMAINTGHDPARMLDSIDGVVRARRPGETVETLFRDFSLANYVKWLASATRTVPARYRYVDEAQTPGAWDYDGMPGTPAVLCEVDEALTSTSPGIVRTSFNEPWSTRYYRYRPDASVPLVSLNFRQEGSRPVTYGIIRVWPGTVAVETVAGPHLLRSVRNDGLEELVVAVITTRNGTNYRSAVNGRGPVVSIIDPIEGRPAQAGLFSMPRPVVVRMLVLDGSLGGEPIPGLPAGDFSFTIGGTAAAVASGPAYVAGSYWFVLNPPPQTAAGLQPLTASWTTVSATQQSAVEFTAAAAPPQDTVLVIDRSGSMGDFSKMAAAQTAARLYASSWQAGDRLGVVSFSNFASVPADMTLRPFNATARDNARAAIDALIAFGATNIGDGLVKGMQELIDRAVANSWSLVLLSDGLPTAPLDPFWTAYGMRTGAMPPLRVPKVHTIALGPDADRALMESIASRTGGTFLYLSEPPPAAPRPPRDITTTAPDLPNDLAEVYRVAAETIAGHSQVHAARRRTLGNEVVEEFIRVDQGARQAVICVNWGGTTEPGSLILEKPGGTPYPVTWTDSTHRVFRITGPEPGLWKLRFEACDKQQDTDCAGDYLIEAGVDSPLRLHFHVATLPGERRPGEPVSLLAVLEDGSPVKSSVVTATVTLPESGPTRAERTVPLYDDGAHHDGAADDGIYGNLFPYITLGGAYDVRVRAAGNRPTFGPYVRLARAAFFVNGANDEDKDGMPDDWENAHNLNPTVNDAQGDPDLDAAPNLAEYLYNGLPDDSDSDGGGENDGSELKNGTNPMDPSDDAATPVTAFVCPHVDSHFYDDPAANPYIGKAFFRVEVPTAATHLLIWRAADGGKSPWVLIDPAADRKTTLWFDANSAPARTYAYRVAAGFGQRISALSHAIVCTAKAVPVAPEGVLSVKGGARTVAQREISIILTADPDTIQMRLANGGTDIEDVPWVPYKPDITWKLNDGVPVGGIATIHAELRDAAGNEGHTDPLTVLISPVQSYGQWISKAFPPHTPNADALARPEADPDRDGVPNLLEFNAGTDPNGSNSTPRMIIVKNGGNDAATGITLKHFRYTGVEPHVAESLEWSTDLATWLPAAAAWRTETTIEPMPDGTTGVSNTLKPIGAAVQDAFLRLRARER